MLQQKCKELQQAACNAHDSQNCKLKKDQIRRFKFIMMPRTVSTCNSGCFYTRAIILLPIGSSCCSVGYKCTPVRCCMSVLFTVFDIKVFIFASIGFQNQCSSLLDHKMSRPYLGIETVYCRLLQHMAKMDMD